jgi:hypothetical protein
MSAQVINLLTELGPVITSGGFITFLSALQVNSYMKDIVSIVSAQLLGLLPGSLDMRFPGGKIAKAVLSMLLAIAIIGIVYTYFIVPIYSRHAKD